MTDPVTKRDEADALVERLIREHGESMYRVAFAMVRDRAFAEDITQESLVRAWLAMDTYRGDGSLRSWLQRITHNTAVSMLRKQRNTTYSPQLIAERADPGAEGASGIADLRWVLNEALDGLDPLSRSIVVLRDVEGFSYDEVAEIAGVTVSAVKSRLFRSRHRLAEALREVEP